MTRLVLRGLMERKLRSVLTALAVVLGVAMIAGTFVQTDAINNAFSKIEETAYKFVGAVVTPRTEFGSSFAAPKPFSESIVSSISVLPGVTQAEGELEEMGQLVIDGKPINTTAAPSFVISSAGATFSQITIDAGHLPAGAGEIAIDANTASNHGLRVGRTLGVSTRTGLKPVKIVGIVKYGGGTSIGGATLILATLDDVQRWYASEGQITSVLVAGAKGTTPEQLVREIRKVLPANLQVRTGTAQASKESADISDAIGGFLTPMLLALAGASLLVGAFIIFNTFSITVAQRTREFGLLRSLGASRRQVLAAVTGEALLVGVLASVAGLIVGFGFAKLLGAMFDAVGFGIPTSGVIVKPRTVIVALAVGIIVTLVAAIGPAVRATRVPPIAALEGFAVGTRRRGRFAPYVAALVGVLGFLLITAGLFAGGAATTRLSTIGGGIVLVFIGVALSARWFVRPLASFIGLPVARLFHEPGVLARENAMRNPGRTATTSAALMVGLGLVVFVAVFAAGLKASVSRSIDDYIRADFIISPSQSTQIGAGAGGAIGRVPGVGASSPIYVEQIKVGTSSVATTTDVLDGVDAKTLLRVYKPDWIHGSDALVAELGGRNALVEQQFAKAHKLKVGQQFRVATASGGHITLRAIGEYKDPQILGGTIVDQSTFAAVASSRDPYGWFVKVAPGASDARVKAALTAALKPYPTAKVETMTEYKQTITDRLNQIIYLLYALLAMSLVISLFGIANSLLLSIHERTREFGLLRAVGATRTQVRRIVRYESVITAVIGGLLGIVIGIAFAALVTAALSDVGLKFTIPVVQLVVFLVLAVVVGMVGAAGPARRGARVDVLDALRLE